MTNILVAEDDPDILEIVALKLSQAGHNVVTATDGAEALELINSHQPELAILDWRMPHLTGVEVCSAIRDNPDLKDIKVVLLTARAHKSDIDAGMANGADDYIVKPFKLKDMVRTVEAAMGWRT